MSSILFYEDILKEERYDPNAIVPSNFGELVNGATVISSHKYKKLREMIELFQVSQKLSGYNKFRDFKSLNEELGEGHPVLFMLANKWGFDAHTVVIHNYTYDNTDGYTYYIYDCSNYVSSFKLDNDGYRLIKSGTADTVSDKYIASYFIRPESLKSVYRTIRSNNNWNSASLFSFSNKSQIYVNHITEDVIITNSEGKKATIKNGELISEFEGIEIATNSYIENANNCFIVLPTDTYTIVGSGDEVITTSFADDYMSASVTAKSSTPVIISSDLKEITVDTATDEEYDITYTTYDNIFDEMNLNGMAIGAVTTKLNDADISISGVNTLTASASVSNSVVSANSDSLSNSNEITVKCEENDSGATIQILSLDTELTEKTTLPERLSISAPEYDLPSGEYTEGQMLTFTKDDETIIYYTTDGSIPSADNGIIYSLPIDINKSMTVKAISTKYGYSDSEIVELNYTLPEVDMPEANIESGEYDEIITIELSTGNYEDAIYYTLDGSDPIENGMLYTVPIHINEDTYLQAYALRNGCVSEISEYEYTVTPKNPFYFPNALKNQDNEVITIENINNVSKIILPVSKLLDGEHSGTFIVAFYNESNELICVKSQYATISESLTELEFPLYSDVSEAHTIKAFIWDDFNNMNPISNFHEEGI